MELNTKGKTENCISLDINSDVLHKTHSLYAKLWEYEIMQEAMTTGPITEPHSTYKLFLLLYNYKQKLRVRNVFLSYRGNVRFYT